MIAVDTSSLMAILLNESEVDACVAVLESGDKLLIAAGTFEEALIVAMRRNVGDEMAQLIEGRGFEVVSLTDASARRVAQANNRWVKGMHPAALNVGDWFA